MRTPTTATTARRLAAAAVLAGLAVTACGNQGGTTTPTSAAAADAVTGTFTRTNGPVAPEFQRTTEVVANAGKAGTTVLDGTLAGAGGELATDSTELDGTLASVLADKVRAVGAAGRALPEGTECTEAGGSSISVDMVVGGDKVAYDGVMSTPECEGLYRAAENLGIALSGFVPGAFPRLDG